MADELNYETNSTVEESSTERARSAENPARTRDEDAEGGYTKRTRTDRGRESEVGKIILRNELNERDLSQSTRRTQRTGNTGSVGYSTKRTQTRRDW
jgi:hypothetical protein